jgi:hypothetical protein
LFLVKQNYGQYQQLQQHVKDCEKEMESFLLQMGAINNDGLIEAAPKPEDSQAACGQPGNTEKAGDLKKRRKRRTKTHHRMI